uniref:Zmp:0000001267 n=1 Tax=Pseudonaja textilis TaxID=8673 RepID=A0A670ZFZ2_PSETE
AGRFSARLENQEDQLPELKQFTIMSENLTLKREIGLTSAISLVAGTMIGSGIFMSPEWVLHNIGSPGGSLIIWAACGLVVIFGALSYAELGILIKESGGDYIYILRTFGSLPAFLFAFSSIIVVRPAGVAAVSLSFAEYALVPFYSGCSPPQVMIKCIAISCILFLTLVNCLSVRLAMSMMNIFTAAKLLALLVIAVGGLVLLAQGQTHSFQDAFQNTNMEAGAIGIAFYQGLWSFDGWNVLNSVTEEVKRPDVTLPRALMIAIPLVACFFLLVNVSYFAAMTSVEFLTSGAIAITWGNKVLGNWVWLMSLAVALSCFGSVNGTFFCGSRVCYIAAREGHMVRSVNILFFPLYLWIDYLINHFHPLFDYFYVPIIIPIIFLMISIYLVLTPIIDQPQLEFFYVILFIFSGIIFYFPLVHYKYCPACLRKLTIYMQLLMEVGRIPDCISETF